MTTSAVRVLELKLPDGAERHDVVFLAEEEGGFRRDDGVRVLEDGGMGDAAFGVAVEQLRRQYRPVVKLHVAAGMDDLDEQILAAAGAKPAHV